MIRGRAYTPQTIRKLSRRKRTCHSKPPSATDLHVDSSDETIRLGPLAVRFLLTGDDSNGSVAAFEAFVPRGQRLTAPGHSHDHYEETIYGVSGGISGASREC